MSKMLSELALVKARSVQVVEVGVLQSSKSGNASVGVEGNKA
jgi:hypothetical protein